MNILSAFGGRRYPLPLSIYGSNPRYLADGLGTPMFLLGCGNEDKSTSETIAMLAGKINYLRAYPTSWFSTEDENDYIGGRPWPTVAGKSDMDQWNETFWTNLRAYIADCNANGINIGFTVWDDHSQLPGSQEPGNTTSVWNSSLNTQGIQWAYDLTSLNTFPNPTNTGTSGEKLVYYQRRWIDRLISEIRPYSNVLIELNNEDTVVSPGSISEDWWLWWAQYFRNYGLLVAVDSGNSDEGGITDSTFQSTSLVQMKSYHKRDATAITDTRIGYSKIIVADADSSCADIGADTGRHMAWRSLCRGGHWNDFVCGRGVTAYPNATKINYYGFLMSFLSSRGVPFAQMHPDSTLTNHGLCLVKTGTHYLVYPETTSMVTIDLTAAVGTLNYEWYNPLDGTQYSQSTVAGGASRNFTPPANTAVLWIYP